MLTTVSHEICAVQLIAKNALASSAEHKSPGKPLMASQNSQLLDTGAKIQTFNKTIQIYLLQAASPFLQVKRGLTNQKLEFS